jgi:hypothetical protein
MPAEIRPRRRALPEASSAPEPAKASQRGRRLPEPDGGSETHGSASGRSPSFWRRHRLAVTGVVAALVAAGFVYYVVPRLVGLGPTLRTVAPRRRPVACPRGRPGGALLRGGDRAVPRCLRQSAESDRVEGELPDHGGRGGRHEGASGGGGRWDHALGVGAARLCLPGAEVANRMVLRDPRLRRLPGRHRGRRLRLRLGLFAGHAPFG